MVDEIYEMKNKILRRVEKDTQNIERFDVREVGMLIDMVKDLAEAEESCMKARYYHAVTEAMGESSGYSGGGMGYSSGQQGGSMGYSPYGRQGYGSTAMGHTDVDRMADELAEKLRQMGPDAETAKARIYSKLGAK